MKHPLICAPHTTNKQTNAGGVNQEQTSGERCLRLFVGRVDNTAKVDKTCKKYYFIGQAFPTEQDHSCSVFEKND